MNSSITSKVKANISLLVNATPEIHKDRPQWVQSEDFVRTEAWSKALTCLVQLAVLSDHYFSERFWKVSMETSDLLNMPGQKQLCIKQIARLKKDKIVVPFGWTSKKIKENTFESYVAQHNQREWENKRRKQDNVAGLINKNGFHFKQHGKTGYLYYVSQNRVTELQWVEGEILWRQFEKHWTFPVKKRLTDDEYQNIYKELKEWASLKNIAIQD